MNTTGKIDFPEYHYFLTSLISIMACYPTKMERFYFFLQKWQILYCFDNVFCSIELGILV